MRYDLVAYADSLGENGLKVGGGGHPRCERCCICMKRPHVCDECNSGHQGQCGYAVHCEQIGEPELLEEVKTGVKMGHKNEAQAQKCGGRCCKCLKLRTPCGSCQDIRRCKARNVGVPHDILTDPDPRVKVAFVEEVLGRVWDALEYTKRQPAAAKRREQFVQDDQGRRLFYAHQPDSVGDGSRKSYESYYTCGCCKCRGLGNPCKGNVTCNNAWCHVNPNSPKTTLEAWGRAKVKELFG